MAGILHFVCKKPVINPAKKPDKVARRIAMSGCIPAINATAQTAPPVAKLPSTDKSAISKIRNVRYTPRAIIPHRIPWPIAPCNDNKIDIYYSPINVASNSSGISIPN